MPSRCASASAVVMPLDMLSLLWRLRRLSGKSDECEGDSHSANSVLVIVGGVLLAVKHEQVGVLRELDLQYTVST